MQQNSFEILSEPTSDAARASSTPCVTPTRRRGRGLSLLGLEPGGMPVTPRSGGCLSDQGRLVKNQLTMRSAGL